MSDQEYREIDMSCDFNDEHSLGRSWRKINLIIGSFIIVLCLSVGGLSYVAFAKNNSEISKIKDSLKQQSETMQSVQLKSDAYQSKIDDLEKQSKAIIERQNNSDVALVSVQKSLLTTNQLIKETTSYVNNMDRERNAMIEALSRPDAPIDINYINRNEKHKIQTDISGKYYQVRKGDNLVMIGERVNVSASRLAIINGLCDPNIIEVGQKIYIHSVTIDKRCNKTESQHYAMITPNKIFALNKNIYFNNSIKKINKKKPLDNKIKLVGFTDDSAMFYKNGNYIDLYLKESHYDIGTLKTISKDKNLAIVVKNGLKMTYALNMNI